MDKNTDQLLSQILEVQRQHLEEYKRVTSQSLELQRNSVETQTRHIRMYRRVIIIGGVMVAFLTIYLFWLSKQLP